MNSGDLVFFLAILLTIAFIAIGDGGKDKWD